jgi:hypothetical protein
MADSTIILCLPAHDISQSQRQTLASASDQEIVDIVEPQTENLLYNVPGVQRECIVLYQLDMRGK